MAKKKSVKTAGEGRDIALTDTKQEPATLQKRVEDVVQAADIKQEQAELQKRYEDAVMAFVEKVKSDPNVIAVFTYGSISHGTVWYNSDTDVLMLFRDQKLEQKEYALYEDNLQINVDIQQLSDFKRNMEKTATGSLSHSFGATYKLLYTKDESLRDFIEEYRHVGKHDMERSLFFTAEMVVNCIYKLRKWINVIGDMEYARFYAMSNGTYWIAVMEVMGSYKTPTREAILEAAKINPELMEKFFYKPMRGSMTKDELSALADDMDSYLMERFDIFVRVADELFGDGEIKTGTQISRFFRSGMHELDSLMNFMCEKGYMIRVSQPVRLTPKSYKTVEEVAYIKAQ